MDSEREGESAKSATKRVCGNTCKPIRIYNVFVVLISDSQRTSNVGHFLAVNSDCSPSMMASTYSRLAIEATTILMRPLVSDWSQRRKVKRLFSPGRV